MAVKKINTQFANGKSPTFEGNFLSRLGSGLKKGTISKTDVSAFSLTSISGACYLVGGTGLLYDFAHQQANKKAHIEPKEKKKKTEGAQTIVPETNVAKVGMKFARVAVALAGVAGVFNGIALNLPILALGEGITSLSAPIIETPAGTGIFGFGLALINLARVLDSNPEFKINRDKFNSGSKKEKTKLVTDNMVHTLKELGISTKTIFKNLFGIFSSKHKESLNFFKEKMFSFKPAFLVLQEQLTKEGKVVLNHVPVNNPYLMHAAALGLTISSLSLIATNLLHKPKAEKASLRGYGVSNGIDNIALSKWGIEKFIGANNLSGKMSGGAFAVAGASLLTGQAGIDKNWGRGLMWNGIGIILLGFSAQTGATVLSALKRKTVSPVVVREWKIALKNKVFNKKLLQESEDALKHIFKENSEFNRNSEEVMANIKNIFSEIKDFKDMEIKKLSDTKDIQRVKTEMLKQEKKYND